MTELAVATEKAAHMIRIVASSELVESPAADPLASGSRAGNSSDVRPFFGMASPSAGDFRFLECVGGSLVKSIESFSNSIGFCGG